MKSRGNGLKIAVRADGHKRIGMGHLYRMLTLSRHLRRVHGARVTFITRNNDQALQLIRSFDFDVQPLVFNISRKDEIRQIRRLLTDAQPDVLCIDLLRRCRDQAYMNALRIRPELLLVGFDDSHRRATIAADLIFNASLFQRPEYYQRQKRRAYHLGLDYVLLPHAYESTPDPVIRETPQRLLVCMGGSDHHNLTCRVLGAIDKSHLAFAIDVAVNSAFFPPRQMNPFARALKHPTRVIYDADGLSALFQQADIAITAAGTTLIERMCAGVPGITISQLRHQAALAQEVMRRGAGLDLGMHSDSDLASLLTQFERLYLDRELRRRISEEGSKLVDGRGLARVSAAICRRAGQHRA